MSKLDDLISTYQEEASKIGLNLDNDLLMKVTKGLGPSIYNADAAKVSCSDQSELDRVKTSYLVNKLGLTDGPELDAAIKEVCEKFGSSNRNKHRALFYYMLAKKFGKEGIYQ
ncbi:DUF2853 family protein [Dyadobacter tibetensis]|uniref:DUF2853 family protein n=1 Tax=Dyadobacter tibetensis TaxID=1211851 RepID=UPI000470EEC4|nr:DUF2853 family protein [Dyadobacter tibetensis]